MKNLSLLFALATMCTPAFAHRLIHTDYYLSNEACDSEHVMIKKKSTYCQEHLQYQPVFVWSRMDNGISHTWHTHYSYSTDTETYPVTLDEALTIASVYDNVPIAQESIRKGGAVRSYHVLNVLNALEAKISSSDLNFNLLKFFSSLGAGSMAPACVNDNARVGVLVAVLGGTIGASLATWYSIRALQNHFRRITPPDILEYLVYSGKCTDTTSRAALVKIRSIMKQTARKKRTIAALKPLEEAISKLPTV